jgi:hypothetical protein
MRLKNTDETMTEPCGSAAKISAIDERTRAHDKAIDGFRFALEGTNKILGKISEALADIRHLHEDQERNEKDINELFDRVRGLELAPGKAMTRFGWIILTAGSASVGGVISGVIVWVVNHV